MGVHSVQVRPVLHNKEVVRRLEVLCDLISLAPILSPRLGCVSLDHFKPAVTLLGLDRGSNDLDDHGIPLPSLTSLKSIPVLSNEQLPTLPTAAYGERLCGASWG